MKYVDRFLKLEGEEYEYVQPVLYIVSIIALLGSGAVMITALAANWPMTLAVTGATFVFSLFLLGLVWRGALLLPRLAFPFMAFGVATFLSVTHSGIRDESMFSYPMAIFLAGLLLRKEGVILFTLLSLLAAAGITYTEIDGLIDYRVLPASYSTFMVIGAQWVIVAVLLYVTISKLADSMRRMRRNERQLADSNQELQTIRTSLEEQVAERSRNADAAREVAEAAKLQLEVQMWQVTRQAQLSDVMRGEQDLNTLADNVVGHLCQYLEAQVGLLFLAQDDALELTGAYAHAPEHHPVERFKFGEGTVGQAALNRQPVLIADIPKEHIRVASGLGETPPKQILAVPFIYEGRLVGVVELGSLIEFTPAHMAFLDNVMENIAIAFHTAQVRTRMDELLIETWNQAEAMQAQEEELRAANEELQAQTDSLRASEARLREKQAEMEALNAELQKRAAEGNG